MKLTNEQRNTIEQARIIERNLASECEWARNYGRKNSDILITPLLEIVDKLTTDNEQQAVDLDRIRDNATYYLDEANTLRKQVERLKAALDYVWGKLKELQKAQDGTADNGETR